MRAISSLLFLVACGALLGCSGDATIRCHDATECHQGHIPGTCEPSPVSSEHWCAFPDTSCEGSMRRWGVASGDGLAGECVAAQEPAVDAGAGDATVPDAAPTCAPDGASCNGNVLERCASGHPLPPQPCELGCVAAMPGAEAHCLHIVPNDAPTSCDAPAMAVLEVASGTTTLDTDDGTICNGGIVVPASAPAICVIRYLSLHVAAGATLEARGSRALALVVDGAIDIEGTLDASADHAVSGPGGVATNAHGADGAQAGGGGGGNGSGGAAGGSITGGPMGGSGGPAISASSLTSLRGGPAGAAPSSACGATHGGGGGGGLALVSCGGRVSIDGVADLGGGGGERGQNGGQFTPCGGAGGGAGGFLSIQGAAVRVRGQLYANGGGGGSGNLGGTSADGDDGSRSTVSGASGGEVAGGASGGVGAIGVMFPMAGGSAVGTNATAGGGGGGTGRIAVYVPSGVSPDLGMAHASPAVDTPHTLPTR